MAETRQSLLAAAEAARWQVGEDSHDGLTATLYDAARASRAARSGARTRSRGSTLDRTLDRLLTSRWLGFPLMVLMLAVVFWITDRGGERPLAGSSHRC